MKKVALILIFIFIILPIILISVVGADVYLTVTNFSPSKVSLNVTPPVVSLSPDNKTLDFSMLINLTTPQAGFIPKALLATVTLYYNSTQQLGKPLQLTLALGKTVTDNLTESIGLNSTLTQAISQGKSITITAKTNAVIQLFGFTIPYTFKVPDQNFTIP